MKRDLFRILRRNAIKLVSLPAVVLGVLLFIYYQYIDNYMDRLEEAGGIALRLEVMENEFSYSKNLEIKQAAIKPEYSDIRFKSFESVSVEMSLSEMQNTLTSLLQSLYFENIQIGKLTSTQHGYAKRLVLEAQFSAVPQQIPRLESALSANQRAMRIGGLEIKAADISSDGGAHLDISAQFLAIHVHPASPEIPKPLPQSR
jgi:hypothetical protein